MTAEKRPGNVTLNNVYSSKTGSTFQIPGLKESIHMARIFAPCIYCGCGCGLYLESENEKIGSLHPSQNQPILD